MIKARVTVTLKNGVLDPQGKAIEGALGALGFSGVDQVRQVATTGPMRGITFRYAC